MIYTLDNLPDDHPAVQDIDDDTWSCDPDWVWDGTVNAVPFVTMHNTIVVHQDLHWWTAELLDRWYMQTGHYQSIDTQALYKLYPDLNWYEACGRLATDHDYTVIAYRGGIGYTYQIFVFNASGGIVQL